MELCGKCNVAIEEEEWKTDIKPETKGSEDEDVGKVINRKEFGKPRSVRENMEK